MDKDLGFLGKESNLPSYFRFTEESKVWLRLGNEDKEFLYDGYKILVPIWGEAYMIPGDYLFVLKNGFFVCTEDDKLMVECKLYEPAFEPHLIRISDIDKQSFERSTIKEIKMPPDIKSFRFASYEEARNLQKIRTNNEESL
jgi:hypothetical protein